MDSDPIDSGPGLGRIELAAGVAIFLQGDPPGHAYLIEEGEVEIVATDAQGEFRLGLLGPGDLLGELAVIDDASRTATARTLTASVLVPVAGDRLRERIAAADPIVRALLRGQMHRFRDAVIRMRGLGHPDMEAEAALWANDRAQGGEALDKIRLESQLRAALDGDGLEVGYQPILDLHHDRVTGYEALARWRHPQRGVLSPDDFIRLAEETSLIVPVGLRVMDAVCAALAQPQLGRDRPFVAVNVSAQQLTRHDVVAAIIDCAERFAVPPSAIHIEITESLNLDIGAAAELIARAHQYGIRVALDDFGTGFSNLAHLHHLHFDAVKLDQSFVQQMLEAPRCHAIVEAIVAMSAALGADLIAEGVETPAQLDALRALGCRYAQGWLIGRPLPAAEIAVPSR